MHLSRHFFLELVLQVIVDLSSLGVIASYSEFLSQFNIELSFPQDSHGYIHKVSIEHPQDVHALRHKGFSVFEENFHRYQVILPQR